MPSLFQSTRNTRLLPTGDMRFIRSDCPEKLTDAEVTWLLQNRFTTIVDLREKNECLHHPCRLETEDGFTYHHMPVTGGGSIPKSAEEIASVYLGMLDEQMEKIIHRILEAETNVLFFCGAGKDRTGVVSAILLKKLGFGDQAIVDDYMKTKENLLDYLTNYVNEHPRVDINTILPNENNIRKVLDAYNTIWKDSPLCGP